MRFSIFLLFASISTASAAAPVKKDRKWLEQMKQACAKGDSDACMGATVVLGPTLGNSGQLGELQKLLKKSCKSGNRQACAMSSQQVPVPPIPEAPSPKSNRADYIKAAAQKIFNRTELLQWHLLKELCGECQNFFWVADPEQAAKEAFEFHVVGSYEPSDPKTDDKGKVLNSETEVLVASAKKPVVLMLNTYRAMNWKVVAGSGVKIEAIYFGGYEQSLVSAPKGVKVLPLLKPMYAYTLESRSPSEPSGLNVLRAIEQTYGMRVTSFQGSYRAQPAKIPVMGDASLVADIQREAARLRESETVDLSPAMRAYLKDPRSLGLREKDRRPGEVAFAPDIRQVAWSSRDQRYYMVSNHEINRMDPDKKGSMEKVAVKPGIPAVGWLGGVAFHKKLNRVYFLSTWHAGNHHAFDPTSNQWWVFNIDHNGGFHSVAYFEKTGKLYGLAFPYVTELGDSLERGQSWNLQEGKAVTGSASAHPGGDSVLWVMHQDGENLVIANAPVDAIRAGMAGVGSPATPQVYFLNPVSGQIRLGQP